VLPLARHGVSLPDTRVFLDALYADLDVGHRFTVWSLPSKVTRWFANPREASQAVAAMSPETDVYCSVAFATEATANALGPRQRISIATAAGMVGLAAGLDIGKRNCPPTEADAQAILDALPLAPSIVVHSGHGLQAWWLWKEPWGFESEPERQEAVTLASRWQATVNDAARRVGGWDLDPVGDLARAMRVPGALNNKSESVPARLLALDEITRYHPHSVAEVCVPFVAEPERVEPPPSGPTLLSDEEILRRARNGKHGEVFGRLYDEGDLTALGGNDPKRKATPSEGDWALAGHLLYWTGGDLEATDRLFRASKLARPKWTSRRGGETYGIRTLTKRRASMARFYTPRQPRIRDRAEDDVEAPIETVSLLEAEAFVGTLTLQLLRNRPREAHVLALPCGAGKTRGVLETMARTYLAFSGAGWPVVTTRGKRRRARVAFLTDTRDKAEELLAALVAAGMPEGSVACKPGVVHEGDGLAGFELVIADEDLGRVLLSRQELGRQQVDVWLANMDAAGFDERALHRRFARILQLAMSRVPWAGGTLEPEPLLPHLRRAASELGENFDQLVRTFAKVKPPKGRRFAFEKPFLGRDQDADASTIPLRFVADLVDMLAEEARKPRHDTRLWLRPHTPMGDTKAELDATIASGGDAFVRGHIVAVRPEAKLAKALRRKTLLVLDSTPIALELRALLGKDVIVHQLAVPENMHVTQLTNGLRQSEAALPRILERILTETTGTVGILTRKRKRELVEGLAQELPGGERLLVGHFGHDHRATNLFEGVEAMVVDDHFVPCPADAQATVEALRFDTPPEGEPEAFLPYEGTRFAGRRAGAGKQHDRDVAAWTSARWGAEALQAIGRARACRAKRPVRVFVLSCDPGPGLHVDQLTTVAESCPRTPTPAELAALRERNNGVHKEAARRIEDARAAFGDVVPSVRQLAEAADVSCATAARALAGAAREAQEPRTRATEALAAFIAERDRLPSSRELQTLARCRRAVALAVLQEPTQVVPTVLDGFPLRSTVDTRVSHPEPPPDVTTESPPMPREPAPPEGSSAIRDAGVPVGVPHPLPFAANATVRVRLPGLSGYSRYRWGDVPTLQTILLCGGIARLSETLPLVSQVLCVREKVGVQ